MKTPRFWYPADHTASDRLLAAALAPLSALFVLGARLRRVGAHSYRTRKPVICVGNVVAGGAGKTPTCLALAKLLRERGEKPVFVTRGYGGRGAVVCVDPARHKASDVGDEALLLAAVAPTWAGTDRVAALRQAELNGSCIIMDDGLQNPYVAPQAAILVIDGEVGLGNGRLIPAGPLRESLAAAAARVSAAVVIGEDRQKLIPTLAAAFKIPAFSARFAPTGKAGIAGGRYVAFAGIARPAKFYATLQSLGSNIVEAFDFPDHHPYTQAELETLRLRAETVGARLITTEKDAVRLPPAWRAQVMTLPVALSFAAPDAEDRLAALCLPGRF